MITEKKIRNYTKYLNSDYKLEQIRLLAHKILLVNSGEMANNVSPKSQSSATKLCHLLNWIRVPLLVNYHLINLNRLSNVIIQLLRVWFCL